MTYSYKSSQIVALLNAKLFHTPH